MASFYDQPGAIGPLDSETGDANGFRIYTYSDDEAASIRVETQNLTPYSTKVGHVFQSGYQRQGGTVQQGSIGFFSYMADDSGVTEKTITGATNASPIVITATAHGYATGDRLIISGVGGNTAANGVFTITNVSANTFSLNGSTGNGAYTSGGIATNRGLYYGFLSTVAPRVGRGGITGAGANGDDVNCFAGYNGGTAKATDAFYLGRNSGIAGSEWITAFTIDANADYGIRLNGTYANYGLDFYTGTFTGGQMRLKNDSYVVARNAADSSTVNVFKFSNLNEFHVETISRFNSHLTIANGANFTFSTGSTGTKIGTGATQKIGFWNATPVVQQTVTGSRGGNAALASLLTALATAGLVVDSSSA